MAQRNRFGGSRVGLILALAAVLALVAGGVWYTQFRSTPEKTMQAIVDAAQADDDDLVRTYLCESSRDHSVVRNFPLSLIALPEKALRVDLNTTMTVGVAERYGDEAVVPVEVQVQVLGTRIARTLECVCVKEKWDWKLDLQKTRQRAVQGLLSGVSS